jgi:hypothetical protein
MRRFDPKNSSVTKTESTKPGDNTTPTAGNLLHPNGVDIGATWNVSQATWTNATRKFAETATAGGHAIVYTISSVPAGQVQWSIEVKAAERNWVIINAGVSAGSNITFFDVTNGVVGTNAAGNTAAITQVAPGVYRCSVTRTVATPTTGAFGIQLATANNTASYTGVVGNGVILTNPFFGNV